MSPPLLYPINICSAYLPQPMGWGSRLPGKSGGEVSWLRSCWAVQEECGADSPGAPFITLNGQHTSWVARGFRGGCGITESLCNDDDIFCLSLSFFFLNLNTSSFALFTPTWDLVAFSSPCVVNVSLKLNVSMRWSVVVFFFFLYSCEAKVGSSILKPVRVMAQCDNWAKEMRWCGHGGPSHLLPGTEGVDNHKSAPRGPAWLHRKAKSLLLFWLLLLHLLLP